MTNTTTVGLLTGLSLGFAGYFGGFGAFIVVAALGLVGLLAGHLARGDVHVSDYVHTRDADRPRGRRVSEPMAPRLHEHGPAPRVTHAEPTGRRERVR
jgi:hypothetical protein